MTTSSPRRPRKATKAVATQSIAETDTPIYDLVAQKIKVSPAPNTDFSLQWKLPNDA